MIYVSILTHYGHPDNGVILVGNDILMDGIFDGLGADYVRSLRIALGLPDITVLVGGVELKSSLYCRGAQNRSPEKRTVTRRTPES